MKQKSQITVCAIALLLLLAGLLYGYQKRQKHSAAFFNYEGYNVVLISLGPLRADHMGCYGYFRNTCPNIDKLARKSIVFKNNHSQCSLTLPSQMSLFTSSYPHEHKVFFPLEATNLNKKFLTLTQILKKNNYTTVWIGPLDNPWVDINRGTGRGFDQMYSHLPGDLLFKLPAGRKDIAWDNAFTWLRNKDNYRKKFFMALYTDRVHGPHLASDETILMFAGKIRSSIISSYKALLQKSIKKIQNEPSLIFMERGIKNNKHLFLKNYDIDNLEDGDYVKIIQTLKELEPYCSQSFPQFIGDIFWDGINTSNKDDIDYVKALYDAEIYEMDETFGILIKELENTGLLQKTIIIVTSDHGEEFFDHGNIEHGGTLYEEVTHIPLIIFLPRNVKHFQVSEPVQSVDIMPTILDLLNIEIPDYARGMSLLPLLGGDRQAFSNRCIYAQAQNSKVSCRFKDWKYIADINLADEDYTLNGKEEELYDLVNDPKEKVNLINLKPEVAKQLKENIETELYRRERAGQKK